MAEFNLVNFPHRSLSWVFPRNRFVSRRKALYSNFALSASVGFRIFPLLRNRFCTRRPHASVTSIGNWFKECNFMFQSKYSLFPNCSLAGCKFNIFRLRGETFKWPLRYCVSFVVHFGPLITQIAVCLLNKNHSGVEHTDGHRRVRVFFQCKLK